MPWIVSLTNSSAGGRDAIFTVPHEHKGHHLNSCSKSRQRKRIGPTTVRACCSGRQRVHTDMMTCGLSSAATTGRRDASTPRRSKLRIPHTMSCAAASCTMSCASYCRISERTRCTANEIADARPQMAPSGTPMIADPTSAELPPPPPAPRTALARHHSQRTRRIAVTALCTEAFPVLLVQLVVWKQATLLVRNKHTRTGAHQLVGGRFRRWRRRERSPFWR
jgi:hypothetical protein